MRTASLVFVVALAVAGAASAQAQEPHDRSGGGPIGVDVIAAPAPGFGLPFRLTKNLTLRASMGFGSAVSGGAAMRTYAYATFGQLRPRLQSVQNEGAAAVAEFSYDTFMMRMRTRA